MHNPEKKGQTISAIAEEPIRAFRLDIHREKALQ